MSGGQNATCVHWGCEDAPSPPSHFCDKHGESVVLTIESETEKVVVTIDRKRWQAMTREDRARRLIEEVTSWVERQP